jgi:glutamyl-tRNA reductase
MGVSVCGFNHKSATVRQREPFQLDRSELMDATQTYKEISGAQEAVVVATCNRVEFYQFTPEKSEQLLAVIEFYHRRGVEETALLKEICYCRQKTTVARHLFRVASGLDSMVLGEDQVFHQLKEAYSAACAVGGPGKILHKIFHLAFQVGKRVRAETDIASGPRSVPGAALELLKDRLRGEKPEAALVCGVNEMTDILLEGLSRWEVPAVVANRTLDKAEKFAAAHRAAAIPLNRIPEILPQVDVVFTATSAKEPILTSETFRKCQHKRPLVILDLAIPRDVAPDVSEQKNLKLYDLQVIQQYLEKAEKVRSADVPRAEEIIEEQVSVYSAWRAKERQKAKVLKIHRELNKLRKVELERFKEGFHISEYRALDAFSQALVKNFMRLLPEVLEQEEATKKSDGGG